MKENHTMKTLKFRFLLATTLLAAIPALAAHISTDYDHSADFAQYKTYSWLKVKAGDSLWEDRIKKDIDTQLAAKGWILVDSNASASIAAFQSSQDQTTMDTFYDGFGGGWRWRGFGGEGLATTTTEVTKIGTLVVDVFDSKTQKLLWRGKETDALSTNSEKNAKQLAKDMGEMFKRFPPTH